MFHALTALVSLRKLIERKPVIGIRNLDGLRSEAVTYNEGVATFELRGVTFAYSLRPSTKILSDVSVNIQKGKVTAYVGSSGSGKSTIASLFLRE